MKPVVVDTTLWVQWLRGGSEKSRQALQGRFVWMPAIVASELVSGARTAVAIRTLNALLKPFERNRRCVVLSWQDHLLAGEVLAQLKWSASPKFGDTLIAVSARKIGAELWTLNGDDFRSLGIQLGLSIINPE